MGARFARPSVEDTAVASCRALIVRPGRGRRWPALIVANGVTRLGRHHPRVGRLADQLAWAGLMVVVPDLPGLARGIITEQTRRGLEAVAGHVADFADVRGDRVALFGVSAGASLALLAAEHPELATRVSVVTGIAPFADLTNVIRLVTTNTMLSDGELVDRPAYGFLGLVVGRSVIGALPPSPGRDDLLADLLDLPDDVADPLALLRGAAVDRLDPEARALVALLANRDPARFDELDAALPAAVRKRLAALSPVTEAAKLRAPIELAVSASDAYFPLGEVHAIAAAATSTRVRVTVTSTLDHAVPHLAFGDLAGLARFATWVARSVHAARGG